MAPWRTKERGCLLIVVKARGKNEHGAHHNDKEHTGILAEIKDKKADKAADLARDHIRTASKKMIELEQSWLKKKVAGKE